ncbi:iron ABC transporter substrate-binding protein [Opitutaceae bacterium EW11]|nr:iron ABC transporter substrate-binding protein [Opitutaceae bacterium EW11]
MRLRFTILLALAAILAVPFLLRPKRIEHARGEDTLVIITPHNEALRSEFGHGFAKWYREKTGRTVTVDWRVIGGTSEITRFLEGEYVSSFQAHWTGELHKPWSLDVQAGFQSARQNADAPDIVKDARATFLRSEVGCGIDLFFGGGTYDFIRQAQAGRLVDSGVMKRHPEWFADDVIPHRFAGEEYWDKDGLWVGSVLSSYGLLYNKDSFHRLGIQEGPTQWADLRNPRLFGEVALADPTKSSSIAKVFENILQQQMQLRLQALTVAEPNGDPKALEARAVRDGWIAGLRLLQLTGANARYFTDTSQKPPIDVSQGDSAVGLCIDFYGRQQAEAVSRRGNSERLAYVAPEGGSVSSVDPIALLRGAPHREVALAFIDYVLSMEGQKLWNFRPGTPGGPEQFALRRLPVRRDFYQHAEFQQYLSDPGDSPFEGSNRLIYRTAWTGGLFREMAFITRVMCMDTHPELARAWKTIVDAGTPPEALAVLQDMSPVAYDEASGRIKRTLGAKNRVEELKLARDLAEQFRAQYRRAEEIARASKR